MVERHHPVLDLDARYEILPGLPSTGPMPERFSASGDGKLENGFVVRFHPSAGASWVGMFDFGFADCEDVFPEPGSDHLVVVAMGQAYVVDPETRDLIRTFGCDISHGFWAPALDLLVFGCGVWFEGLRASGRVWKTRTLSWDGFRNVRMTGTLLLGEAYTPMGDTWHPFEVDLETGEAVGGSYDGP